ncbi:MAG: IS607 family transposase [Actinobacteria bacterium]|nr:IS607 family transposase [Actinomycetota bacterium]NBR66125.1 IS607 family transposase [Actinomycetota bacterium]
MSKNDRLLTLSEATEMLGVHENTVRRWGDEGTLRMVRTSGGHRRFPLSGVEEMLGGPRTPPEDESTEVRAAVYCRVSSHDQKQKGDLERQVGRVTTHCVIQGYKMIAVLEDVGSGMSENRPRLRKLFGLVNDHEIDRVVVEHKDRLSRFGFGLLEAYFNSHGVEIEWTDEVLGKSYEEELVEDILSLMASFSARIYGKRSAENRKKAKADAEAAK